MRKKSFITFFITLIVLILSGCRYEFPEDSKIKPHTYDEALEYIQDYLNRDDVILSEETLSGETENGYQYVNFFARVDEIDFVVSSQELCHYDVTIGEFRKVRYNLYKNFNYEMIHYLFMNNQDYPDFELRLESNPYLHIHNIASFTYEPIINSEEDLIEAFNRSKTMYEWMVNEYPNPRYLVKIQVNLSDRPLYIRAHKIESDDQAFGFNQFSYDELIDEYYQFYD
jgi:hypothetical protein